MVRFMCSRSGIPAQLIEEELERVEERCNWVLDRLDYPKRIRFSGFKELGDYVWTENMNDFDPAAFDWQDAS